MRRKTLRENKAARCAMNEFAKNLPEQERAIRQFLRDYLGKQKDEQMLRSILADVGRYYDADRAYIFELNEERTQVSNTGEWCREGVTAEIGNLQNIPMEGFESLFTEHEEKGELFVPSLSED